MKEKRRTMEENIALMAQAHARITLKTYRQTGIEGLAPNHACISTEA